MSFKRSKTKDLTLSYKNLGIVKMADKVHRNCLRVSSAETDEHALAKFWVCRWLREEGFDFISECRFIKKNKRADIYVLDYGDGLAIEVVKSEKANSVLDKRMSYPCMIEVLDSNVVNTREKVFAWCDDTFSNR